MNEDFSAISRPTPMQVIAIRKYFKKNRQEMADILGVHYRTWSHYECGTTKMPKLEWQLLLMKLGLLKFNSIESTLSTTQ